MSTQKDIAPLIFALHDVTFLQWYEAARRNPAAHLAMRKEREAAVSDWQTDREEAVLQRLKLEREGLQEWPVSEGRWVCAATGESVRDTAEMRALGQASVDVGPHDELRLPLPELADLLRNAGEHAMADSPLSSLGRDGSLESEGLRQFVPPEDSTAAGDGPTHPFTEAEDNSLDSLGACNTTAAKSGDTHADVPAPPTRGVKRRHDECQADSNGRSPGEKRLRRDASMLLTGAALTYAALAYL